MSRHRRQTHDESAHELLRGARRLAAARPTTRSRRRTAGSRASTTPTRTPTTPPRPSGSRRSTPRTRRCAIPSGAAVRHVRRRGRDGGARSAAGNPFDAGAFGLNDLFDAFFGGDAFGGGREGGARRGPDAETVMRAHARRGRHRRAAHASTCACRSSARRAAAAAARPAPIPTVARPATARRGAPGAPVAARPDRDRRPVPEVRRDSARSIRSPVRRRAAATAASTATARSRSRCPPASTTGSACGSRAAARPRRVAARPATSSSAVRVAPHPRVRTPRRRPLAPAARSRSCRPRSARRSQIETLDGAREIDVAVGHAARRAHPAAGARRAVAAHRPARRSRRRGRRATCRRTSIAEEAELLAQFAAAPRRGGHARRTKASSRRIRSAFRP